MTREMEETACGEGWAVQSECQQCYYRLTCASGLTGKETKSGKIASYAAALPVSFAGSFARHHPGLFFVIV